MDFLTYLRDKAAVTLIRYMIPCPCTPTPDQVIHMPSRDPSRTVKAHVYRSKRAAQQGPCPVLLNFHGSGYVMTWHGSDDYFCRRVADETDYTVLDVQYRLGPEEPFPGAPHDVEDAIKYVLSRPREYDATHISISGFSAGGTLALGAAMSEHFPQNTFRTILAIYPPTDVSIDPDTKVAPDAGGKPIASWMSNIFNSAYIGNHDSRDPLISPVYADITRLPKNVLIITCACDSLAPETEALADRIADLGDATRYLVRRRVPGVDHAWDKTVQPNTEGEKKRDEVYTMAIDLLAR